MKKGGNFGKASLILTGILFIGFTDYGFGTKKASSIPYPDRVGDYVLQKVMSERKCEEVDNHPDSKHLGISGKVCSLDTRIEYRNINNNKGVCVILSKITDGKDVFTRLLEKISRPTVVQSKNLFRVEKHEIMWFTTTVYDAIWTQEFSFELYDEGKGCRYHYSWATGNNPVTQWFLKRYSPIDTFKTEIRDIIQKSLPSGWIIESPKDIIIKDVDNDKEKEIVTVIRKNDKPALIAACRKVVVLERSNAEYKLNWESEEEDCMGKSFLIQDINKNGIPDIIIISYYGGSGGYGKISIVEQNKRNYQVLFCKETKYLNIDQHIKDLNNDGNPEIVLANHAVYHIPRPDSHILEDLFWYDVYKWNGKKYIKSNREFLGIYDNDIKLAEKLLKYPEIKYREEISQYLKKINMLKNDG